MPNVKGAQGDSINALQLGLHQSHSMALQFPSNLFIIESIASTRHQLTLQVCRNTIEKFAVVAKQKLLKSLPLDVLDV